MSCKQKFYLTLQTFFCRQSTKSIMAGTSDDNVITAYFEEHTAEALCSIFEASTNKRISMGGKVVLWCCNEIVIKGYQCHILNKAMNKCLKGYKRYSVHVAGGNQSITIKLNDNLIILSHQVHQWDKYKQCDANDPWKKKILQLIKNTKYKNNFELLFFGMFECKDIFCRPSTFFVVHLLFYASLIIVL